MAPTTDIHDSREANGLENARILVVTDEVRALNPLLQLLLAKGLWVESWEYRPGGFPASLVSPIDVMAVFVRAEAHVCAHELRRVNPGVFFALIHEASNKTASQAWLLDGFDGRFSLEQPHEHISDSLAAAARFVRRLRVPSNHQRQHAGSLTLDCRTRTAELNGRHLDLTAYEFSLLSTLAQNLGNVLTRQELLELAKGSAEEAFDRSIDVQVSRLRAKLGDNPRRPNLLKTVRGKGYVLVPGTLET